MENSLTLEHHVQSAIEWHLLEQDPDSIRQKLHAQGLEHHITEEVMLRLKSYIRQKQSTFGRKLIFAGCSLMILSFPLTLAFNELNIGFEYALYTTVSLAFIVLLWGMSKIF